MTGKWEGGKGSRYRNVDQKKYSDNWDAIFKNKEKPKSENEKPNVECINTSLLPGKVERYLDGSNKAVDFTILLAYNMSLYR